MNKQIIALIALIAVIFIGWTIFKDSGMQDSLAPLNPAAGGIELEMEGIKDFAVVGKNFSFSPNTISVNEGDTVRITFTSENGTHDLVVDEFDARTSMLKSGESESIVFVADKAGTFEFYCSIGNHRQMGMVGTIVVN